MVGVICAPPLPTTVATTSEEATTSIPDNHTVQTDSKTEPTLVSEGGRLSVSSATCLAILHSNAHSLCIIGIKPRLTSLSETLQQQILSLGFLTPAQISMLLQILPV